MFKKERPINKSPLQEFSFYCLGAILLIFLVKKTVSLGVTPFLILTGVNYFLLGLLIGDLGWGFFSSHSKGLFLRTNWLLKMPFSLYGLVMHRQALPARVEKPVEFSEMVSDYPGAKHVPNDPVDPEKPRVPHPSEPEEPEPDESPQPIAESLMAQADMERTGTQKTAQAPSALLANFGKPLTPEDNGEGVAKVLENARPKQRAFAVNAPQDSIVAALRDVHKM